MKKRKAAPWSQAFTSSVRKIGILVLFFLFCFLAYAGGIIGLFHVEGKINATGGMLYIV